MPTDVRLRARCLAWLIPSLVAMHGHAVQPTPVREADAPCARCHAATFRGYLATPMANASGLAGDLQRLEKQAAYCNAAGAP